MNIIKRQIAFNRTKRTQAPAYIVIHDTENKNDGADALAHFNYFNGGDRQSSADFFVDDRSVIQVNDYNKFYTWHCGDGKGKYGITNKNSLGIEICVNSDGDYDMAVKNAIELVKILMRELNIPIERVIRHYDASKKNCPASMSENSWLRWWQFKNKVNEVINVPKTVYSLNDVHVQVIDTWKFKIKKVDTNKKVISEANYFNAGFFGYLSGGNTIPVGNLVIDGKIVTDANSQPDWLNTSKKKQTTLVVYNDNSAEFVLADDMATINNVKYAISGVPIIRNGYKVALTEIAKEGYDGTELYDTWHGFLGIRDNRLVYVASKLGFDLMVYLLEVLGIKDAIKLDGGGSFILHNGNFEISTSENRRIHNIITWEG